MGRRVLLVEDNPEVAEVTRELLTGMGCDTETVRNAEEALERSPRVVSIWYFSDIVMAGSMNGLDLARDRPRASPGSAGRARHGL